ncbi:2-keto-4-pentenoate hydratase [Piscinibacter sakaiensis]|uniref:2-keto-4-pentenoate hydratase n=1 Tax=Piscinibacter sakaiensis TaxID=1547922 RepID=UPI003AAE4C38
MSVDTKTVATHLLQAYRQGTLMALPSAQGNFTLEQAFAAAEEIRQLRIAAGETAVGYKIGFTNRSIWPKYGVFAPIWAPVWDSTTALLDAADASLSLDDLVQPRLEPEIVFGFARAPEPGMSAEQLIGCLDWVAHGVEIVHTHFEGWKFTAADSVADFGLHGALRVGPRCSVRKFQHLSQQLADLQIELACDGEVVDRGQGSLVLDSPLQALHLWLQAMQSQTPQWQVKAGDVVTTGTLTDAWPLRPGQRWTTRLSDQRLADLDLSITD